MHRGFIKLWRKFNEWRWINDPNVCYVFIRMLLLANWKDKPWMNTIIKRGSFVASRKNLAKTLGISEQALRTVENKLNSTHELTRESTNQYMIYTIVNYELYQDQQSSATLGTTQQSTNEQQTSNKRTTTTKEGKRIKRNKEPRKSSVVGKVNNKFKKPTVDEVTLYCKERGNSVDSQAFVDFYESKGWLVGKSPMKDWKAAVRNWARNNRLKQEAPQYKEIEL